MSRARDVVETIARALADRPDRVTVTETEHRGVTLVELFVSAEDIGRVIGRQGRTAAAIRTLASVAAQTEGLSVRVDIREPGEPR